MHNKRILVVVLLAASILSILAMSSDNGAKAHFATLTAQSGFVITSPAAGSLVPCGQPITVTWTGGEPSDNVNVVLIDVQANQVFQGFGVEPNTGSRVVTIGPGSCGRTSRFYVEDDPRTTWTYGPVFNVSSGSACTPPPANMVSWWPGDGNANDIQGSNNGALQNGATFGTGKVGQAFSFDGMDDFVDVQPNSNLDLRGALSIDAWVNPSNLSGDRGIVEKTVGGGVNTQYSLYLQGGSVVFRLIKVPGVQHATLVSDSLVPLNAWTHIAATWDGATMKMFVNGVQQSRMFDLTGTINGGEGSTLIGKQGSNINHFEGLIDELEIFNRALSSQEVSAIYLADSAGKCKPASMPTPTPTPTPSTCGSAYNAVSDFSKTSNPNGAWSYGWEPSLGGAFTLNSGERSPYPGLDTWEGPDNGGDFNLPFVSFNHSGLTLDHASGISQPANMLNLHPSFTGKFSVLRWTAPSSGSMHVVGLFKGIDTRNTTTDVHVLQNSATSLVSANINGFGSQSAFDFTRDLAVGETLDFVVGWGSNGNYNADSTGLAVTITLAGNVFNISDGDVAGLIAAINAANASACPTTINLAPHGNYTLTDVADDGSTVYCCGPTGLPFVNSTLKINGNGATIRRSNAAGTPPFGIIRVAEPPSNPNSTIGNLTLDRVTLTGATGSVVVVWGGSTAMIRNTTITRNEGQGILTWGGNLTVLNSTISYNNGTNGYGGGGILHIGNGTTAISFSTIFENQSGGVGDAIATAFSDPGSVTVKNSILASPTRGRGLLCWVNGQDAILSLGHNIAGDSTCGPGSNAAPGGFTGPGDMNNTNPLLGPLGDNDGPTPTHVPMCNSPAIDGVPIADSTDVNGVPITIDQRGVMRPLGAGVDIGAVEVGQSQTVTIPSTAGPWNQSLNPAFNYGVHDNGPSVVIDTSTGIAFTPGSALSVTYVSGLVQAGVGFQLNDANGLPGNVTNHYTGANSNFPAFYMNPGPDVNSMALVATFANNGLIVGNPFLIGNGPTTLTVPAGANQLLLGINDNFYGDNSGSFNVSISSGASSTTLSVTAPADSSGSADVNCQAAIPDYLAGTTTSGGGSGVTLSQSPAAGTLVGLGPHTVTVTAVDSCGSGSDTVVFTVIDNAPPTITISTPSNGASYLLNQSLAASYSCADCGGVASCIGPVPSGSNINTASVGMKTFTVSASDIASNSASQSVNYLITYGVRVLFDQARAAKSGSTIPIKVQLIDANGNNVSSPSVVVHAVSVTQTSSSASVLLDDAGQANPDFDFRYDSSLGGTGGYIFNLKTTGYGTGTYVLNYAVGGDPVIHTVQFQVRQ